jgi:uncharacterized protein (DUF1810 family)
LLSFAVDEKTSKANFTDVMSKETNLERFIDAQERSYQIALSEIKNGKKESHWMWYIFPQVQGLGFSETSKFYAIKNIDEAKEFLLHPVLGNRLVNLCNELLKLESDNANSIFGSPDDLKLKSSMTLFSSLNINPVFQMVLDKFFNGKGDNKTLELIGKQQ